MKKYDVVKLKDINSSHKTKRLELADFSGLVWEILDEKVQVLFLNKKNRGDYAVGTFDIGELEIVQEVSGEWQSFFEGHKKEIDDKKDSLMDLPFEECDCVELITERPRYTKLGLKKGMTGVVAIDFAVRDEILIDFGGSGSGLSSCDLVSVKLKDLRKV